ncbi:nitrate reductase, partial [Vibrio parahaemolyticus]
RDSYYFDLFKILLELSEENVDAEALHQQVSNEDEDYTPEALDAVWEEEQIRFLGEEGCNSALQHQHQRRFVNNVSPQYLNISDINGVQQ